MLDVVDLIWLLFYGFMFYAALRISCKALTGPLFGVFITIGGCFVGEFTKLTY